MMLVHGSLVYSTHSSTKKMLKLIMHAVYSSVTVYSSSPQYSSSGQGGSAVATVAYVLRIHSSVSVPVTVAEVAYVLRITVTGTVTDVLGFSQSCTTLVHQLQLQFQWS